MKVDGFGRADELVAAPVENGGLESEIGDDGGEICGGAVPKGGFEGERNAGVNAVAFECVT